VEIQGRTALVTGGAEGIGRACAIAVARKGAAKVILVDVDEPGVAETSRLVEPQGAGLAGGDWVAVRNEGGRIAHQWGHHG
jgi:NAD(P)-dependent dehydrogenase (short-subunit alcohol dehydrogenase family)